MKGKRPCTAWLPRKTAVQVSRHLAPDLQATVVTHSQTIAVALSRYLPVQVVLIGGRLFKRSVVTAGAAAGEALNHVRAGPSFIGATDAHVKRGLSMEHLEESYVRAESNARRFSVASVGDHQVARVSFAPVHTRCSGQACQKG